MALGEEHVGSQTCAAAHTAASLVCIVPHAGTDVMLLESFSTDGSSHHHHGNNLSAKRRSSVTFEDQVEHSKGRCPSQRPYRAVENFRRLIASSCFFFPAENDNPTSIQINAEVHKSLDAFASCLAKAIENDAKLALFGEDLSLTGGIFSSRAGPRPRYLDGQRLRLESIDEGIVKDDRDEAEEDQEDQEEKPA